MMDLKEYRKALLKEYKVKDRPVNVVDCIDGTVFLSSISKHGCRIVFKKGYRIEGLTFNGKQHNSYWVYTSQFDSIPFQARTNSKKNEYAAKYLNKCLSEIHSKLYNVNLFLIQYLRNPRLVQNIFDSGITDFNHLYKYDLEKMSSSIKEAFGISAKYIRAIGGLYYAKEAKILRDCGFSPDEVDKYKLYVQDEINTRRRILYAYKLHNYTNWYNDYLRLRNTLKDYINLSGYPECPQECTFNNIHALHNKLVEIFKKHKEVITKKQIEEKQINYEQTFLKEAKSYNYEDDSFSIIACEDLVDLLKEGKELHHCVGSYIDSVANGNEFILFLRKKSEIDTPFFTIDITPNKKCRQIHGINNCNINSKIEPFMKKWAETFGIDISDCSGLRCALND